MKKFAVFTMIVGILTSSSSIVFTMIDGRYDNMLVAFYWGVLSGFEFLPAWILLFSKSGTLQHLQKMTLAILIVLVAVWIILISNSGDAKPIFMWALKILNYSGLYFVGLFLLYRENQVSKND